jgi:putative transposase
MPKLRHYDDPQSVRFITFGTYRGERSLNNPETVQLLLSELLAARNKYGLKLLGYVVMPEHVHLVIFPPPGTTMGLVVREIKSKMARAYFRQRGMTGCEQTNVFWQKRCYDRNCRTPEEVREKVVYCHKNPVKRGLVREMSAWRWSSYNWYMGEQDVPLEMDVVEF